MCLQDARLCKGSQVKNPTHWLFFTSEPKQQPRVLCWHIGSETQGPWVFLGMHTQCKHTASCAELINSQPYVCLKLVVVSFSDRLAASVLFSCVCAVHCCFFSAAASHQSRTHLNHPIPYQVLADIGKVPGVRELAVFKELQL